MKIKSAVLTTGSVDLHVVSVQPYGPWPLYNPATCISKDTTDSISEESYS